MKLQSLGKKHTSLLALGCLVQEPWAWSGPVSVHQAKQGKKELEEGGSARV